MEAGLEYKETVANELMITKNSVQRMNRMEEALVLKNGKDLLYAINHRPIGEETHHHIDCIGRFKEL